MERNMFLRAIFLFSVCLTTLATGSDGRPSPHANKTQTRSTSTIKNLTVVRNENVELGTTITLNCTSIKVAWHDMIFVIWKIQLHGKECVIAVASNDSDHDTCQDGKKQIHIANGTYHLIISNFSVQDEGNYTCDISYKSGGSVEVIKVLAWAHPQLSGWLESGHEHNVAVCKTTGKSAASIHWETPWNISSQITQTSERKGQLSTVVSRLQLPQDASLKSVTCVAIANDLKHAETRFSAFTVREAHVRWPFILLGVCATCITIGILSGLYIRRKNLRPSGIFRKVCCKLDIPASNEEKPQQPSEPEELQPYASYVQRVNSIYNSSAELFKA